MIASDFEEMRKTFIHTCLNIVAIGADILLWIFCCENFTNPKMFPFELLLLTLHNERMNRKKGLIQHLIVVFLLLDTIIIIMIEPFPPIPHKRYSEICFHRFLGDRSERAYTQRVRENGNYAFCLLCLPNHKSDKGFNKKRNHNGMNYDERFRLTSCFHQI